MRWVSGEESFLLLQGPESVSHYHVRQFSPAVTPEDLTPLLAPVGTQTNTAYVHTEEAHMCTLVENLFKNDCFYITKQIQLCHFLICGFFVGIIHILFDS